MEKSCRVFGAVATGRARPDYHGMRNRLCLALLLLATPVLASTPAAWDALDKAAQAACGKATIKLASKARIQSVTGRISGIGGNGDQYYGLLMRGRTAGFPSQWLCLYDKRAKTVQVRELEMR
jgi:hypothetical protein